MNDEELKRMKDIIGLTDYQKQLVDEFVKAGERLSNAGVYSIVDYNGVHIRFINRLNCKRLWIDGWDVENDRPAQDAVNAEKVALGDIETVGGADVGFPYSTYSYPEEYLYFELKK